MGITQYHCSRQQIVAQQFWPWSHGGCSSARVNNWPAYLAKAHHLIQVATQVANADDLSQQYNYCPQDSACMAGAEGGPVARGKFPAGRAHAAAGAVGAGAGRGRPHALHARLRGRPARHRTPGLHPLPRSPSDTSASTRSRPDNSMACAPLGTSLSAAKETCMQKICISWHVHTEQRRSVKHRL